MVTKYYYIDQSKEDDVGESCDRYEEGEKCIQVVLAET
jgi:hypothetical protein